MSNQFDNENQRFQEDGFVLVPGLLNPEETKIVVQAAHGDSLLQKSAFELADAQGGRIRLSGWNHAGDDTLGIVARTRRMVDRMEAFLGRRSVPLPLQDDSQGAQGGRRLGMASGLRVLVPERMFVSLYGELLDCYRSLRPGRTAACRF